jgi:hypothetical protein
LHTWLDGKSTINGSFNGKIIYRRCSIAMWLPEHVHANNIGKGLIDPLLNKVSRLFGNTQTLFYVPIARNISGGGIEMY